MLLSIVICSTVYFQPREFNIEFGGRGKGSFQAERLDKLLEYQKCRLVSTGFVPLLSVNCLFIILHCKPQGDHVYLCGCLARD